MSPGLKDRNNACVRAATSCVETLEERRLLSTVVALVGPTQLAFFDTSDPDQRLGKVRVRGLQRREALVAIDYRPATAQLYGVGDSSRVYTIDPTTGQAAPVDPTGAAFAPALTGLEFSGDFNPVADRLRVVTDTDNNVRIDPGTGQVVDFDPAVAGTQTDLALAYAAGDAGAGSNPNITALAYTRADGPATTAYGIDADRDALVRFGSVGGTPESPNAGGLTTVGPLGVEILGAGGFDVDTSGTADIAYAALTTGERAPSVLYTINLDTGAATPIGEIRPPGRRPIRDIAVVPTGDTILVLNNRNRLNIFNANLPNVRQQEVRVTGLQRNERLRTIDVRASNDTLYAFSNRSRLYTINRASGAATAVGEPTAVQLNRRAGAGMNFNPAADTLRIVNTADENIRLDPATGQIIDFDPAAEGLQFDGPLVYASTDVNANADPNVSGLSNSNNLAGATATTTYAVDSNQATLVTIGTVDGTTPPETGRLFTVGPLGVNPRDPVGFDILSRDDGGTVTDTGYMVFRTRGGGNRPSLYRVDLETGAATAVGALPGRIGPIGIAVLPAEATPVATPPPGDGTTDAPQLSGLTLVNAETGAELGPLTEDTVLLPGQLVSVRADPAEADGAGPIGSVVFGLDDNPSIRTDNSAPYTIAGEENGQLTPLLLGPGPHTITATPHTGPDGTGTAGTPVTVQVTVPVGFPGPPIVPPPDGGDGDGDGNGGDGNGNGGTIDGPALAGLTLINAETGAELGPLTGDTPLLPGQFVSVRADPAGTGDSIGSVVFGLDGNANFRTENFAPYSIAGDANGQFEPLRLGPGPHTITATPYSGPDGTGTAGTPVTVQITVPVGFPGPPIGPPVEGEVIA